MKLTFKKKYPADFWRRVYRAYTRKDKRVKDCFICHRSKLFESLWGSHEDKDSLKKYAERFVKQHPEFSQWRPGFIYLFYTYDVSSKKPNTNIRLKFLKWMIENI